MSFRPEAINHLKGAEKIRTLNEMPSIIRELGHSGMTVVLAQGVFDLVHVGHVGYLRASHMIDPSNSVVVVGVENDDSVRRNKGDSRSINPLGDRMDMLAEFVSVSLVFPYEDTPDYQRPEDFINRYQLLSPAAIAVPTWDPHRDLKEWQASEAGTHLALVDYRRENSTTRTLHQVGYSE